MTDNVWSRVRLVVVPTAFFVLVGCETPDVFLADRDFDQRVYAGAGVSVSQLEPNTDGVPGVSVDDSGSSGAGLLLGYDINNRFSVEGHIADLGESTLTPEGSIAYTVAGISGLYYGLNDKEARLRRQGFSVFGRLGIGTLDNDAQSVRFNRVNDVHVLAGAGVEYGFTNGLAARAEFIAHETDAKYAQLALLYRFGRSQRQRDTQSRVQPTATTEQPANAPDTLKGDAETSAVQDPQTVAAPTLIPEPVVPEPIEQAEPEAVPVEPVDSAELAEPTAPNTLPSIADSDEDGVLDVDDECTDTVQGSPVDSTGCEIFNGVIEGVNFMVGSADLTQSATEILSEVAQTLRDYPDVRITIEAHTDNMGDATTNLQLSRRRALSVARYLMDEGISGTRLKPQAFGESIPRQTNATVAGRAANRRVEFNVVR